MTQRIHRHATSRALSRLALISTLAIGLVAPAALSQPQQQAAPAKVTEEIREAALADICRLLRENYIFPDKAEQTAKLLEQQLADGYYDTLTDANDFAARVTQAIQSVTHDLHLNVRSVPPDAFLRPDLPEAEQIRRYHEQARRSNYGFHAIEHMPGNVGYLDLRGFAGIADADATAIAAMNFLASCDAVIIDLRQNGGGSPHMIGLISSYFFKERTHLNSFEHRHADELEHFYTRESVPGPAMHDTPLYVLTSGRTFSAAEEFSYNMRNLERATLVGEVTGGGAHPGGTHPVAGNFSIFVADGRAISPITQTNWEGVGVKPHIQCAADQALDAAYMHALENIRDSRSEDDSISISWAIDGLRAKLHPYEMPENLKQFVGEFGERRVFIAEDGNLYYARGTNPPMALIPMAKDQFYFAELDYFRLRFTRDEDDVITGVQGMYNDGRVD